MAKAFKVGDTVELSPGSPVMVIVGPGPSYNISAEGFAIDGPPTFFCSWFSLGGVANQAAFPAAALVRVPKMGRGKRPISWDPSARERDAGQ